MYGDAEVTVSTTILSVPCPGMKSIPVGGAYEVEYLISVLLTTSLTTYWPLKVLIPTPLIRIGVSTSRPVTSCANVTVISVLSPPPAPSPARILEIPTSSPRDPTIRYSSILDSISTTDG